MPAPYRCATGSFILVDDVSKIIITAGLTLAGGIVVAVVTWLIQSKREHSKWVREQRFILYGEIMGLASSVFIASRASKSAPEMVAKYEEMDSGSANAHCGGFNF
jgi:hypothetical protein